MTVVVLMARSGSKVFTPGTAAQRAGESKESSAMSMLGRRRGRDML